MIIVLVLTTLLLVNRQWGRYTAGTYSDAVYIQYPLAMKVVYTAITAPLSGGSHYNDHATIGQLTPKSCRLISGFNGASQLAEVVSLIIIGA